MKKQLIALLFRKSAVSFKKKTSFSYLIKSKVNLNLIIIIKARKDSPAEENTQLVVAIK